MSNERAPVDDARLNRLELAARVILDRPERHTPLELQWATQVADLAAALRQARRELDELRRD